MENRKFDIKYELTNREKSMFPKKSKFWCYSCDMQLVREYQKIGVNKAKKIKKMLKEDISVRGISELLEVPWYAIYAVKYNRSYKWLKDN